MQRRDLLRASRSLGQGRASSERRSNPDGRWDWLAGPWFEKMPVSPVHPAWDDPSGRRLKRSVYASIVAHLLIGPLVLLVANVHITKPEPQLRLNPMTILFSAPPGNSPRAPRTPTPPAPRAAAETASPAETPPKPAPAPPKTAATPTADTRPRIDDGHRVHETADPKETPIVPAPEKGSKKSGAGTERVKAPTGKTPAPPAAEKTTAPREDVPVTEPVAKAGPLVASVAGPVAGSELALGDLDGIDFPHSYYLEQIRDKIAQQWDPPVGIARGRRVEATVRFRILRNGQIGEQLIEVPSGVSVFDQAALRAVVDSRRFGPLPDAFPGEFLVVHFQFSYTSP